MAITAEGFELGRAVVLGEEQLHAVDGGPAGHLTSVAAVRDGFVALASVRRAVVTPADAEAGTTLVSLLAG